MESLRSNWFDIFEVYRRYCDIRSGNACFQAEEGYRKNEESQMAKCSRDALVRLSLQVESTLQSDARTSIFDELCKLMPQLHLMVDFLEFSRFYEFVYFVCRENGQKNITVRKAISAWRLVLAGRFRLLNQWCDFVEKNQRHNISEDTWRQVLAFSRCVHENLEGYDPAGAWPVLIDDFVEHMYSVSGSNNNLTSSESQTCVYDDSLPGLKSFPGLKRKGVEDMERDDLGPLGNSLESINRDYVMSLKRNRLSSYKPATWEDRLIGSTITNEYMENTRHSNGVNNAQSTAGSKSHCAIEDCLSQGFAGLFPTRSCLQFKRERRAPFGQSYKPSGAEKVLPRVL